MTPMTPQKIFNVLVGLALAVVAFLSLGGEGFGASVNRYEAGLWQFGNGIYAGLSQQFGIDSDGDVTTSGTVTSTGTIALGSSGTAHSKFISGTCNATQKSPGSHAATTSMQYYCAVTGAASGDKVFVSLPVGAGANADGAASLFGGFTVVSANATSSNFIQFAIFNGTGAASTSFAQATTSVAYWIGDN
jgi:hypothetical protein